MQFVRHAYDLQLVYFTSNAHYFKTHSLRSRNNKIKRTNNLMWRDMFKERSKTKTDRYLGIYGQVNSDHLGGGQIVGQLSFSFKLYLLYLATRKASCL